MKMTKKISELYQVIHTYCFENKELLNECKEAVCFYCKQKVICADINDWCNELSGKESAICPHCGIDSVIPYKVDGVYEINDKTLDELNEFYFSPF